VRGRGDAKAEVEVGVVRVVLLVVVDAEVVLRLDGDLEGMHVDFGMLRRLVLCVRAKVGLLEVVVVELVVLVVRWGLEITKAELDRSGSSSGGDGSLLLLLLLCGERLVYHGGVHAGLIQARRVGLSLCLLLLLLIFPGRVLVDTRGGGWMVLMVTPERDAGWHWRWPRRRFSRG